MASKITRFLSADVVENKVVHLSTNGLSTTLKVHGSTMKLSVPTNAKYVSYDHLTIYPEEGVEGIVAIEVRIRNEGKYKPDSVFPAFLKLEWREGEEGKYPFVDLEKPWVPADRIGDVAEDRINVEIRGKRFTFRKNMHEESNVNDGNLLCRYLWGTADATEVLHAATQKKVEESAAKQLKEVEKILAEVRVQNERLESLLSYESEEHRRTSERLAGAESYIFDLEQKQADCKKTVENLRGLYQKLCKRWPIFRSREHQAHIDRLRVLFNRLKVVYDD